MSPRERARHGARFPHHPWVTRQGRCGDVSPGCASRARAGMTRDDATRCDAPGDGLEDGGAVWVHQLTSHDSRRVGHSSCLSLGTRANRCVSARRRARRGRRRVA